MLTDELTVEEANLLMKVRTDCGEFLSSKHWELELSYTAVISLA